jgi:hypothetical protein
MVVAFDERFDSLRSFPRKRESSDLVLGPRFRGDERIMSGMAE